MRKTKLLFALVTALLCPVLAFAQNSVTGKVTSSEDGLAVVGATVYVEGSVTGAVTDADGVFEIKNLPASAKGKSIVVSCIGYVQKVVPFAAQVNVVLDPDKMLLDEVVVTALGITKSQKSLGYSATTVRGDQLAESRGNNPVASLAGKVAGVQISNSATTAGGAQTVVIRGLSSIANSNSPLYVIDGIPIQSASIANTAEGSGNLGMGLASLNPDDIENITVLKGAAATAMYGSRASGGVVMVTTKSGAKGHTEVTINAGVQFASVSTLPEFQNTYGTGWDGSLTLNENGSWGPVMNDQLRVYGPVVNNSQLAKKYSAVPNNVRNFYETGVQYNTSVAVSGGNDKTTYYFSYSNLQDDGILPRDKDTYDKNTLAVRGSHKLNKTMKISSTFNYSDQLTNQVSQGQLQGSMIQGLYQAGRDISFIDAKDLTNIFNRPEGWYTPYSITNPYWIIDNSYNKSHFQKLFGKVQFDWQPIRQLTVSYRYGFDRTNYDNKLTMYQIAIDPSYENSSSNQEGSVQAGYGFIYETNHDFLVNFKDDYFDKKFDVNATVGMNANERGSQSMGASVTGLSFDTGFWNLSNTSNKPSASESFSMRRSVSVFADLTLGWADQVYLNATARNDWSSTLPVQNRSFFYPGVTASWIATNTFDLSGTPISFAKLRVAYGMTGNDPSAYLTEPTFVQGSSYGMLADDMTFPFNGYNGYQATNSLASATLEPEMTTEFEVGADVRFFGGRIGIDFAYYDRISDGQIFPLGVDPATGYSSMTVNFGKVQNKGVELLLTTTPVKTRSFEWNVDFNFAKNYNTVLSMPLGSDSNKTLLFGASGGPGIYAEIGKPLGAFYATMPQYTEDGKIICNANGLPIQSTDDEYTGYSAQNDWTGGLSTSIRYKRFSASASFDIRWGGKMYSSTKQILWFTGNSIETTYNNRKPFIIPNSVVSDGAGGYVENTTPIYLENDSYQAYFAGNDSFPLEGGAYALVDRSYVKLRNLSISYDLPEKWIRTLKLTGVRVSAVGNNLLTWTPASNCYIDPDQAYDTSISGLFGEWYASVPTRYFGFNIQVKF